MTQQPGPSPDVIAQVKAQRSVARWAAVSAVIVALISISANIFQVIHNNSGSGNSSPPASQLSLGPFEAPDGNSDIGQVVNLSGPISGLKVHQLVWTFNEPLTPKSGVYFPDTGPCTVSANTWTCDNIYIGESPTRQNPKAGLGPYRIWVVVVSEQDAFNIVNALRCQPTATDDCSQTFTSLPGSDIAQPQFITVTRTH